MRTDHFDRHRSPGAQMDIDFGDTNTKIGSVTKELLVNGERVCK